MQNQNLQLNPNDSQLESLQLSKSSYNIEMKNSINKLIKHSQEIQSQLFNNSKNHTKESIMIQNNFTDLFINIMAQQWEYI